MRVRILISILSIFVISNVNVRSQDKPDEVFSKIVRSIILDDVSSFSSYFSDNLDVSIFSSSGIVSKNQAKQIVAEFFEEYKPRSFELSNFIDQNNRRYALGRLVAGGDIFSVTIQVDYRTGQYKIQQIKITRGF